MAEGLREVAREAIATAFFFCPKSWRIPCWVGLDERKRSLRRAVSAARLLGGPAAAIERSVEQLRSILLSSIEEVVGRPELGAGRTYGASDEADAASRLLSSLLTHVEELAATFDHEQAPADAAARSQLESIQRCAEMMVYLLISASFTSDGTLSQVDTLL